MGVKLLVVLTNNHDEKIILHIVALKLHFGQRIILLLPLELNHGLNEPLSYKNDRRKKTFRITTPRCQFKRYGLWSHCPVQCPHVQFNWDNLNAGINFLMSEGSGSQPFIFRPHNQTTPFQNYESLNKRKCFCASSEEQKTKKDHHVCRCLNFCPNSSEEKKKVITSADVQISAQNQAKSKKKASSRPRAVFFGVINSSGVASFPLSTLTTFESATKGVATNTKYLSLPLPKCLMTPRLRTTVIRERKKKLMMKQKARRRWVH